MKKIIIRLLMLSIVVAIGAVFSISQMPINQQQNITIKPGATLYSLAHQWQDQGWLKSARLLLLQAKISGGSIRPGEFDVPADLTAGQLLDFLAKAQPKSYKLSFIEGTRASDALKVLAAGAGIEQDVQPLNEATVKKLLKIEGRLEGWLFPDTYVYFSGDKASAILQQAYQRTQQVLAQEWQGRAKNLPYQQAYQALIMASIVEKETGQGHERPMIAGVFTRRLDKNMRMETDPTVIYGLGENYQGNLRKRHLQDRSNPYNTYRNKGLPPSPIALAGRAAIYAALHPAAGEQLYFVAKGDGSHYFSSTLAEHNKAVRKYQIFRRTKNYRSAPSQ